MAEEQEILGTFELDENELTGVCSTSIQKLKKTGVGSDTLIMFFQMLYERANLSVADKYWIFEKKMKSILSDKSEEDMIVTIGNDGGLSGCSFITDLDGEKVVSRTYIFDRYDGINVATTLMQEAIQRLKNEKPIVKIKDEDRKYFKFVAKVYDWDLKKSPRGLYNDQIDMSLFQGKA